MYLCFIGAMSLGCLLTSLVPCGLLAYGLLWSNTQVNALGVYLLSYGWSIDVSEAQGTDGLLLPVVSVDP